MKKTRRIFIRIDDADLAVIRGHAAAAGMTLSSFVRDFSLIPQKSPQIPADVRRAISGFGRNLNQLSHHCNTAHDTPAAESLDSLRAEISRLIEVINGIR